MMGPRGKLVEVTCAIHASSVQVNEIRSTGSFGEEFLKKPKAVANTCRPSGSNGAD